jgi:hypothetical protein
MDIFSLIIAILLGFFVTLLSVLLFIAIIFNVKRGRKYRQALAKKIEQLRLHKMLLALGIDPNAYLHKEPIAEIHQHMERCNACENTEQCDEALATHDIKPEEIGYCNNEKTLQKIAAAKSGTVEIT